MLDRWLEEASDGRSPELGGLDEGLCAVHDAVQAALLRHWSNTQVEGQIHHLKVLKSEIYGRANLDLLKRRAVAAG